ncbi:hypothetical protein [Butyrivibrio sp. WCE2006]|uniref:hypothetical protein n=1 Tax=Butyrivibrio sp. WCE2006 TaxID=1410611 RepID=UPI0005D18AB3|nr:hypothetical protein [Butyrivibrio sp. WCE2006]
MGKYDDILNIKRPVSKNHQPMPIENRAAQFMPFAALTGYDDAVAETARYTEEKIELTEEKKAEINEKLSDLELKLRDGDRVVTVTFFVPDELKSGGEYVTREIRVKRIDTYKGTLVLSDKTEIWINDILSLLI